MPLPPRYASQGAISFLARYARRRFLSHGVVLLSVLAAVTCAVASQYAVKNLVDVLGNRHPPSYLLWGAVALLLGMVAADNLLWRLAGWVSTYAFVAVGGDLRRTLSRRIGGPHHRRGQCRLDH
jgi:ATP-binding cassette subfamily B protein